MRLVDSFTRHLAGRTDVEMSLSLSRQSEGFGPSAAAERSFHVDTFRGRAPLIPSLLRLPTLRRDFARFVRANRTEVIFASMRHAFLPWILPSARRQGVRVLLAVHDAAPHLGDGYPLWRRHFQLDLAPTDGIITMSDFVAREMTRVYGYPAERTFRMALPAPDFGEPPKPRRSPDGRPWRLMFFGRIRAYKGLDLLADAYRVVRERLPVTLRVVGEGGGAALDRLATLPGVTVERRWVPETEMASLFDGVDLLVLPYREASQSGVTPTAFAHGIPVVATPVGGLSEQVVSGVNGLVAPAASARALADSLVRILEDRDLYAGCSAGALAAVKGPLSTGRSIDSLLAASRALLNLPPRER